MDFFKNQVFIKYIVYLCIVLFIHVSMRVCLHNHYDVRVRARAHDPDPANGYQRCQMRCSCLSWRRCRADEYGVFLF